MKEYKRLTTKCEVGIGLTETNGNIVNDYEKVVNRLAELEDKIENGTLVTVPYAIGQEVYWVDKKGYFDVDKVRVSLITIKHDGSVDIRLNHYNDDGSYSSCFKHDTKYGELFNTQKEAEKRLKEIRVQKDC